MASRNSGLAFAIAILAGLVIFGGLRSIARFAELVVALMGACRC